MDIEDRKSVFRDETHRAMENKEFVSGVILMVGALMKQAGITEFSFDPREVDFDLMAGLLFEKEGNVMTVRMKTPTDMNEEARKRMN